MSEPIKRLFQVPLGAERADALFKKLIEAALTEPEATRIDHLVAAMLMVNTLIQACEAVAAPIPAELQLLGTVTGKCIVMLSGWYYDRAIDL